jgi:hypothetical protein
MIKESGFSIPDKGGQPSPDLSDDPIQSVLDP